MFFDAPLLTLISIVVVSVTSLGFVEARRHKKKATAAEGLVAELECEVTRTRHDGESKVAETDGAYCMKLRSLDGQIANILSRNQVLFDRSQAMLTEKQILLTEKQVLQDRLNEERRQKTSHSKQVEELKTERVGLVFDINTLKKERDAAIKRSHTSEGRMMALRNRAHGYRRPA